MKPLKQIVCLLIAEGMPVLIEEVTRLEITPPSMTFEAKL